MDFGVVIPSSWSARQVISIAKSAEDAGLDFLLLTDHYMTPISNSTVDAWAALAAVAATTERIRFGTCVTPVPFRPPAMLAKILATVDQISDGRVIFGVGAGWHRAEFDAYSEWADDKVRAAKTAEALDLMTKLWAIRDPLDFHGKYFKGEGIVLEPKPVQEPYPSMWFGALGPFMLKLAAKYGEAWVPPVPGVDSGVYKNTISALRSLQGKYDKPERWKEVKVRFNGTLSEISEGIERQVAMGCNGAILARMNYEELPSAMKKLSSEVAPSYR